jgi:Sigma-70, region 4
MIQAVRWPVLHDDSNSWAQPPSRASAARGAWRAEPDALTLVKDGAELPALLAEATSWAERITVCVSAPASERGTSPWWRELLARNTKIDGVYLRRPEQAEGWLLHRLHAAGSLRLVEAGGRQVASNLLLFARGGELRVLLSHIPLERALAGAAFGALLSFRGTQQSELARACRAQVESWAELARIPTGSDIDALTLDPRRREPAVGVAVPRLPRVLIEPTELAAGLARWAACGDDGASVRSFAGGYRVVFEAHGEALVPLTLSLHAGPAWAAGNALLLDASGRVILVWRGGLLGHSRARSELSWSEARSPSFVLESAALGLSQRVAVVAQSDAPLGPQLATFARELTRLGEAFGVEPPPALGHVLADFSTLSSKQQTRLIWRALLGLGALELGAAARVAAEALRDQGYLRGEALASGSAPLVALAALIEQAALAGRSFDRPSEDRVRAIQPELAAYVQEDWLACLLEGLPEGDVVARRTALRRAFERARDVWGLEVRGLTGERLAPASAAERALESCVSSALCNGLLVRVGAAGLKRPGAGIELGPAPAPSNESVHGFLDGWTRALDSLAPVQRFLLTRRAGWYGRREALESVAERLGLSLERARQIEAQAWRQIELRSSWARTLRARLERALGGARSVPVRRLVLDDAWWRGVEERLELCEAVFEGLLGAELELVELGAPGQREAFFARFSRAELERALGGLLERAAHIPTPAAEADYRVLCELCAAELDAGLAEYLRDALEPRLVLDASDPGRVLGFAPGPRSLETLPLETLPLETLPALPREVDSEALLRLEDVMRSVFRTAGTPLPLSAVAERVRKRLDVSEATIAERLASAPFVQRNADQYGLIARDVPGGAEAIASVLDDLAEALSSRQRPLTASDAERLAEAHVKRAWSPELLCSLIAGDPALHLSAAHDTTLRRWEHARLVPHSAPIGPGLPARVRARFEQLAQQPLPATEALRRRLACELGRLERTTEADDLVALPLARQLYDVSERLLEHAAGEPPEAQQLTHAAIGCVLDALSPDEDALSPDEDALDAEKLFGARAVLAAVLRWLELDWLAGAPPARRPSANPSPALDDDPQSGTPTRYNTPSPSLET